MKSLPLKFQTGYCANVHPGRTIQEVQQNLARHAVPVKSQFCPEGPMGIGLWLSETSSRELDDPETLTRFRDWLEEAGLLPFTFNGFPFGDFHQTVVKHEVYLPTWADRSRLDYTVRLAEIQHALLPAGMDATISTLPLGWPNDGTNNGIGNGTNNATTESFLQQCAKNLQACAQRLHQIEQESGRNVFVCIEPEPGCVLDTSDDIVDFFQRPMSGGDDVVIRKHIGVCHDVCHSAVMFEDQKAAIDRYRNAGIRVGKVQVSSAVGVDFDNRTPDETQLMLQQLNSFVEPRYLHQTTIKTQQGTTFFEDLPLALNQAGTDPVGQWRVHFHVPIFSESLGLLDSTQQEIDQCLSAITPDDGTDHFEVETYAWNVLPDDLAEENLADGIAKEMLWFEQQIKSHTNKP